MIRARFHIRKDDCDNDYRPVKWPIKYPYWCSAESSNSFVLVAYAEDEDSIKELWPEAYDINVLFNSSNMRTILCKYIVYFSILTPTRCANIFGGYNKTHFIYKSYSIA